MRKQKFKVPFILFIAVTLGLFMTNCQDDSTTSSEKGTLSVKLTDAPFPSDMIAEANVKITRIEIREAGENEEEEEQNEGEGGEEQEEQNNENSYTTINEGEKTINLLNLRNGVTDSLANIEIEQGEYDLVRLHVEALSVKLNNGTTHEDFDVPSSVVKVFIEPAIAISGGARAELLLDFDVSESFVVNGNTDSPAGIKGFKFKPVIRAVNNTEAGRIIGSVTNTSDSTLTDAKVWAQKDTAVATTFTEAGEYELIGLPTDTYSVYATKSGYDTASVAEVKVVANEPKSNDLTLTEE